MSEGAQYIGLTIGAVEAIEKHLRRLDDMGSPTRESAEREEQRTTANDRQVGGAHYRKGKLQHWDVVEKYGVPYLEGVGSKYPLRWREKGGIEDLEKTLHYIDKILERPSDHPLWQRRLQLHTDLIRDSNELCEAHGVGPVERRVALSLLQGVHLDSLQGTRRELADYIERLRTEARQGAPEDGGQHAAQEDTVVPLECSVDVTVTEQHLHLHLPDGCGGTLTRTGDQVHLKWSRSGGQ